MSSETVILILAVLSLLVGLGLYLFATIGRGLKRHFHATNLISWLLIALFPVLIIFSFFPESSFSSQVKGLSIGGAIGAFIFIWWWGGRSGLTAAKIDELETSNQALQTELAAAKARSQGVASVKKLNAAHCESYKIVGSNTIITLFTGGIHEIRSADVWVNSENTNMQMARFFDRSVSGTIRYLGAKKDRISQDPIDDTIGRELQDLMGERKHVNPAAVLVTNSGELAQSHNVKKIFHVASVQGEPWSGYHPIRNISDCVAAVLRKVEDPDLIELNFTSIAMPLFGVGTAQGKLEEIVPSLLEATLGFFQDNAASPWERILFLTWSEAELLECKRVLDKDDRVTPAPQQV